MAFSEIDDDLWLIISDYLPPQKPRTGRPRSDLRLLMNGILFVLTTGCTWSDVPEKYGTKSTVHRFHQYLCENRGYQGLFFDLLRRGYDLKIVDLSHCSIDTKSIPAKKGVSSDLMARSSQN
ncbi:transposase [Methanofollis ethanolicus]|uniref:transposase n=1 Tax=Methanofollis ethanolicus TaxID=488124 RepID=UPI0009F963A0